MSCIPFFAIYTGNGTSIRIRLGSGTIPTEGRVEVLYDSVWGSIVDDNWDINDANVICRQLGFAEATSSTAQFGNGKGPVYMTDMECSGSEVNFLDCWYTHVIEEVDGRQDVAVECQPTEPGMF